MRASSKKFNKCQIIFVILKIFNLLPLFIFIIFRESLRPIRPSSSEDNLDIPVAYLVCGGSRPPSTVCRSPSSASSWSVTETEPYYHRPSLHSSCSINLSPHCTAQRARTSRFCTASSSTCTCRPLILDQELLRHKLRQRQRERRFSRCAAIARSLTSLSLSLSSLSLHSPPSSTSLSLAGSAAALRRLLKSLGGRTDGRTGTKMRRAKRREVAGRKEGRKERARGAGSCVCTLRRQLDWFFFLLRQQQQRNHLFILTALPCPLPASACSACGRPRRP